MSQNNTQRPAILTKEFVASFPHLYKPQDALNAGEKPKYSVTMLYPQSANLDFLVQPLLALVAEKKPALLNDWKKAFSGSLANLPEKIGPYQQPFRNGDNIRDGKGNEIQGYKGMIVVKANSIARPPVVRVRNGVTEHITDEQEIYGGVILRASLELDFYGEGKTPRPKKGFAFRLRTIVKVRDGERFGRGPAVVENDFSNLAELEFQASAADALAGV